MFGGLFSSSVKSDTHSYHMVIHVDGEPRNKVRDVRGEFTMPDDGNTIAEVQETIIAGCCKQLGVDVFMVSFNYK